MSTLLYETPTCECLCALGLYRFSVAVFLLGLMICLAEARAPDVTIEHTAGKIRSSVFIKECEGRTKVIKKFSE